MSKKLDDLIAKQFDPSELRFIDIPEFVVDGKPYRFSYTPPTVEDIAAIVQLTDGNQGMMQPSCLALKLCEADGTKYFPNRIEGKLTVARKWPPEIVQRIYYKIMEGALAQTRADLEEQEKN